MTRPEKETDLEGRAVSYILKLPIVARTVAATQPRAKYLRVPSQWMLHDYSASNPLYFSLLTVVSVRLQARDCRCKDACLVVPDGLGFHSVSSPQR